jgi:RHS repeat-associated protein
VGGLLEVSYHGTSTTNAFVAYDGNGNVTALINVGDGTLLANYDYGPFGEVIRATGPMAKTNPFRFLTKYQDDESDLLYYGYRYYRPSTGTWPNRDLLTDNAFFKVVVRGTPVSQVKHLQSESLMPPYDFVRNNPISRFDKNGQVSAIGGGSIESEPVLL